MSIKETIKKLDNPFIKAFILARRLNVDEDFFNWMKGYDEKTSVLDFVELGELNKDKNVYLMHFDSVFSGFFACWKRGLTGLMFAERYKLTPVISWGEKSAYYEENGVNGQRNPFEYYYEQVSNVSVDDAFNSYNVVFYGKNSSGESFNQMLYNQDIDIDIYAEIAKKYYRVKDDIKKQLDQDVIEILKNKKTLGVQVRGVEWGKVKDHPIPLSLEKFVEQIDKAIEQCGFEQIFLATDAEDTVEYISNKYPGKVVVYSDVARAAKGSKMLAIFDSNIKRDNNNFLLGYEVLRDMFTLVSCQGLIASYSNISFATEVTKKTLEQDFEFKCIMKTEISKTGVSVAQAADLMKKNKFDK